MGQVVLVSCSGGGTTDPVGPPTSIAALTASSQSAVAGTAVSTAPRVRVTDAGGRGVAGVSVTFQVTAGGGSIIGGALPTDANGDASVDGWTLGATPGLNTLTASVAGLSGSPVTFTATGLGITLIAAHGNSAGNSASPSLASLAISGTSRLLLCVVGVEPATTSTVVTSIVLDDGAGGAAQALTQLGSSYAAPGDGLRWTTWYVAAPTLGARRLAATLSATALWTTACVSYGGVDQTSPFGIVSTAAGATGAASLSTTSNAAGSLPWAHIFSSNNGFAAGTGVFVRQASAPSGSFSFLVDGNARFAAGSSHLFNWSYSGQFGGQAVMLRPAASP